MNKIRLFLLAALLVVACGKQQASLAAEQASPAAEQAPPTVEQASPDDDPAPAVFPRSSYRFVVDFVPNDDGQCEYLSLECRSGEMSQEFGFEFNWPKDKDILVEEGAGEISEDDINGDGWPDVVVCLGNFGVLSPLYFYGACVWNPDDESFKCVWEYEGIPNAEPCQLDGQPAIKSVFETPDGTPSTDYYIWEGRKLILKQ